MNFIWNPPADTFRTSLSLLLSGASRGCVEVTQFRPTWKQNNLSSLVSHEQNDTKHKSNFPFHFYFRKNLFSYFLSKLLLYFSIFFIGIQLFRTFGSHQYSDENYFNKSFERLKKVGKKKQQKIPTQIDHELLLFRQRYISDLEKYLRNFRNKFWIILASPLHYS